MESPSRAFSLKEKCLFYTVTIGMVAVLGMIFLSIDWLDKKWAANFLFGYLGSLLLLTVKVSQSSWENYPKLSFVSLWKRLEKRFSGFIDQGHYKWSQSFVRLVTTFFILCSIHFFIGELTFPMACVIGSLFAEILFHFIDIFFQLKASEDFQAFL